MGGVINPNIALSYQAPQFQNQNPIQTIGSIYSLKNLMQEGQYRALQMQQAQLQLDQLRREEQERKDYAAFLTAQLQPQQTTVSTLPALTGQAPAVSAGPALMGQPPTVAPLAGGAAPSMSDLMNLPTVDRAARMGALAGIPVLSQTPGAPQTPVMPQALTNVFPSISPPAAAPAPVVSAPVAAASRAPDAMGGLNVGQFLARFPTLGPGVLKSQFEFQKAQNEAQKAEHENQAAVAKGLGGIARGIESAQDKNAAFTQGVMDAVSQGYMTPAEGRALQARGYHHDDMQAFIERADNFKDYHEAGKADIESLAKAQENAGNWMKGVNDQATYSQGYSQLDPRVQQMLGPTYSPALREHAISWTVSGAELPKMQMGSREAAAGPLAAALSRSPQEFNALLATLPPDTQTLFMGAKDARDVMMRAQSPDKYAEEQRLNRQQLLDAERVRLERQKFGLDQQKYDAEYGPGTAESAAAQIYANPDSVREVLGKMAPGTLPQVQIILQSKYGMPLPLPLEGIMKQQEGAALSTAGDVQWIRNALKNPNIANNVGPLLGNIQNVEQATGMATGLAGADAQMAQEFRTRMRGLITNEAGAFYSRGIPGDVIKGLVQGSPKVNMDAKMLQGALDGVEGGVRNKLDTFEQMRWGNKKRPPEARGLPSSTVKMKAPDGTVRDVSRDQVDHYKSLGATVVE